MAIRIKICGITTPEDGRLAAEAGADAIGVNFFPKSPRYVPPARAAEIVRAMPPFTTAVGLFIGVPIRQACAVAFQLGLRAIQTYDDQPPPEDPFPFAHIPAFRVKDEAGIEAIRRFMQAGRERNRVPAAVLVDSFVEGQMGGTGHRAPWKLLDGFDPGVPLILAGGLTPENVGEAIKRVRPWGVDVASGVEAVPGRKDSEKMKRFVEAIRSSGRN